jgi:hypothetical protein
MADSHTKRTARICYTDISNGTMAHRTAHHCKELMYLYVPKGTVAHSTALLGSAVPLFTERYNGPQHCTAQHCYNLLYRYVPNGTMAHSTAQHCYNLLYSYVPHGTMAHSHNAALLGSAVPLCTERYNGPQPQHSTARIRCTVMYRTVQ